MTSALQVAWKTDRGRRRRENEDSVLVRQFNLSGTQAGSAYLLAVADGMGGAAGGQVASSAALDVLEESVTRWSSDPTSALRESISHANAHVRGISEQNPELSGMATTLVTAFVAAGRAWIANIGDSRAYLIRDGQIQRLTHDHSWVGEQVRAGVMTDDEALAHPRRNIITRSVGSDPRVEADLFPPITLRDGDLLVLCSDGLYGLVKDSEIAAACLARHPETAADSLVDLANSRGGPDNISVVIAAVSAVGGHTLALRTLPGASGRARTALLALSGLLLAVALVGLVVVSQTGGSEEPLNVQAGEDGKSALGTPGATGTVPASPSGASGVAAVGAAGTVMTPPTGSATAVVGACPTRDQPPPVPEKAGCISIDLQGPFISSIKSQLQAKSALLGGAEVSDDVVNRVANYVWLYNDAIRRSSGPDKVPAGPYIAIVFEGKLPTDDPDVWQKVACGNQTYKSHYEQWLSGTGTCLATIRSQ